MVWPLIAVLHMGWSHPVYIGQLIHTWALERQGMLSEHVVRAPSREVDYYRHGAYIDNYFSLQTSSFKVKIFIV